MKEIIRNIFRQPEPDKRICTVTGGISAGWWSVSDPSGRTYRAESDQFWRPGDTIILQSGRIIGRAAAIPNQKIYEV